MKINRFNYELRLVTCQQKKVIDFQLTSLLTKFRLNIFAYLAIRPIAYPQVSTEHSTKNLLIKYNFLVVTFMRNLDQYYLPFHR